jgi:hypothetical protein
MFIFSDVAEKSEGGWLLFSSHPINNIRAIIIAKFFFMADQLSTGLIANPINSWFSRFAQFQNWVY